MKLLGITVDGKLNFGELWQVKLCQEASIKLIALIAFETFVKKGLEL